jgi:galactose mutarotase-like enzyme
VPTDDSVTLTDGSSVAVLAPYRGGLVTRFEVAGRAVLFMDDATLADPTKNVRGGVPVLFPTPGKLTNDAWSRDGKSGALKQHGFARNLAWRTISTTANTAVIAIESDAATRASYPWDFAVEMTVSVRGAVLRLDHRVTNRGETPMPFGFGFHPYFVVRDADKSGARVSTGATKAFDNVTKTQIAISGPIDLTQKEVDLHLLDHGGTASTLSLPGGHAVDVRGSSDYTHWVVWTLAGRDFVCLEPWTAPGDSMNTGDRVLELAPGATRALWIEIASR